MFGVKRKNITLLNNYGCHFKVKCQKGLSIFCYLLKAIMVFDKEGQFFSVWECLASVGETLSLSIVRRHGIKSKLALYPLAVGLGSCLMCTG